MGNSLTISRRPTSVFFFSRSARGFGADPSRRDQRSGARGQENDGDGSRIAGTGPRGGCPIARFLIFFKSGALLSRLIGALQRKQRDRGEIRSAASAPGFLGSVTTGACKHVPVTSRAPEHTKAAEITQGSVIERVIIRGAAPLYADESRPNWRVTRAIAFERVTQTARQIN